MADESVLDLKGRGELIASATARADTESEVSTCSSPSSDSRRALRGQKARAAEGATVEKISGAKLGPGNGNAQVAQNHVQDANQWNNCPTRSNVNINAYFSPQTPSDATDTQPVQSSPVMNPPQEPTQNPAEENTRSSMLWGMAVMLLMAAVLVALTTTEPLLVMAALLVAAWAMAMAYGAFSFNLDIKLGHENQGKH